MALHIANPEVIAMIKELARREGTTMSEAVKLAAKSYARNLASENAEATLNGEGSPQSKG